MTGLPPLYFRRRGDGAQVFRVHRNARDRRVEMEPLARLRPGTGDIHPQGGRVVSPGEEAAIRDWMRAEARPETVGGADDVARTVALLGCTAHWAQAVASDDEIDALADELLLAMQDLRGVLVRRKAAQIERKG
jgi:hypothetical protein